MPKISIRPDGILDPEGRYPNPFTEIYSEEYKKMQSNLMKMG